MASSKFTDAAGNNNTAATQFNWTYDTTAPTMAITAAEVSDGGTSNDGTLSLTFTSSEATTNFVVGDITVSGGALSSFAATSSTVYTATFTPSGAGATTIDVASSKFTDAAGNNNTAATQFNWTYDTTAACTVNGQDYRTTYDTSGTYITLSNLTSRAGSWNNSTDLVMKCDVSQFTSMYRAFRNNSSFNQDISAWDVSNVTNMNGMFQSATSLTSVSFSDTSSVTDMSFMFASTTNLTSVSLSDTSNVTDMSYMFYKANSFNQNIIAWDVSNATNLRNMFYRAGNFSQDIRRWDVSNVTNFSLMFSFATEMVSNFGATANWNTTPTAAWFTPDTTAPTMAITAAEISDGGTSNDATLSLTFTSSEATTNFVVGDITVSGGALSSFAATSSTVYTATFTPTGSWSDNYRRGFK